MRLKKVKIAEKAFKQLGELLEGCSGLHKSCKLCPRLNKCIVLWDQVIVNGVEEEYREMNLENS